MEGGAYSLLGGALASLSNDSIGRLFLLVGHFSGEESPGMCQPVGTLGGEGELQTAM